MRKKTVRGILTLNLERRSLTRSNPLPVTMLRVTDPRSAGEFRGSCPLCLFVAMLRSLLLIHFTRRQQLWLGYFQSVALPFNRTEETGLVSLVTSRPGRFHLDQQSVAIAIESDVLH